VARERIKKRGELRFVSREEGKGRGVRDVFLFVDRDQRGESGGNSSSVPHFSSFNLYLIMEIFGNQEKKKRREEGSERKRGYFEADLTSTWPPSDAVEDSKEKKKKKRAARQS